MTSIEKLFEQLEEQGIVFKSSNNLLHISIDASDYLDIKRIAKEMHKQELVNFYYTKSRKTFEEFFEKTFGSKGSDDTFKVWECCGMEECICKKQEISDEDIQEYANEKYAEVKKLLPYSHFSIDNLESHFIDGMKKYRELLKNKL